MSANHIESLAKALYENGNPQHTTADRAMLGPFEEMDAMEQTIWFDLANAAHNHLTQAGEGTTDAGLVDLIAAHVLSGPYIEYDSDGHHADDFYRCGENCKWTSNEGTVNRSAFAAHAAHVAVVVEEQTNERSSARLREHVEELATRGLPADLNPTTLGDADYVWWSNYLRRIDQTVRSNARAALEGE